MALVQLGVVLIGILSMSARWIAIVSATSATEQQDRDSFDPLASLSASAMNNPPPVQRRSSSSSSSTVTVDVTNYGATGDGVTDDGAALET